jgi:hypothetical protein
MLQIVEPHRGLAGQRARSRALSGLRRFACAWRGVVMLGGLHWSSCPESGTGTRRKRLAMTASRARSGPRNPALPKRYQINCRRRTLAFHCAHLGSIYRSRPALIDAASLRRPRRRLVSNGAPEGYSTGIGGFNDPPAEMKGASRMRQHPTIGRMAK